MRHPARRDIHAGDAIHRLPPKKASRTRIGLPLTGNPVREDAGQHDATSSQRGLLLRMERAAHAALSPSVYACILRDWMPLVYHGRCQSTSSAWMKPVRRTECQARRTAVSRIQRRCGVSSSVSAPRHRVLVALPSRQRNWTTWPRRLTSRRGGHRPYASRRATSLFDAFQSQKAHRDIHRLLKAVEQ